MSEGVVKVTIDPGTPEFGQWCDTCQLPSGVRVPLSIIGVDGVATLGYVHLCDQGEDGLISHDSEDES